MSPPRLALFAKGWTFAHHPPVGPTWPVSRRVAEAAAAGFDGFHASHTPELRPALACVPALRFWGQCDVAVRHDIRPRLTELQASGAESVLVQLGDHDTGLRPALELARRVYDRARQLRLDVSIEVHRDTCTETPEKTWALADAFARVEGRPLPLTWDFSHPIVVKHLRPPFRRCLEDRPDLIQSARCFHLRPCNGHHAQIPVRAANGRLTPEYRDWLDFIRLFFALWLAGPRPGNEMLACPELGGRRTNGYCLSTYPAPWPETITCARHLRRIWREVQTAISTGKQSDQSGPTIRPLPRP